MMQHDLQRNPELGQVWTPDDVAREMARLALDARSGIKFVLDPACGPATFSKALHEVGAKRLQLDSLDVDERMVRQAMVHNEIFGFVGDAKTQDYLADTSTKGRYDLIIMNPPYIRQEQIPPESKKAFCKYLERHLGGRVDRRSNLFALFLLKGVVDLGVDGILCAIVYDAITQSGYGKKTLALMERHARLLSSTHVQAPFDGVLVDAQILLYQKRSAREPSHKKKEMEAEPGCVPLSALLKTRRGTALPVRKGYLAEREDPFFGLAVPFFIKQGRLEGLVVHPDAWAYLEDSFSHNNYDLLVWIRNRAKLNGIKLGRLSIPPVSGQILFNYYIRNAPRHLWNGKKIAVSDNFYVSSTKNGFPAGAAWLLLNSDQYLERLVSAARNQGSGLKKLQLFEYKQVVVPDWRLLDESRIERLCEIAMELINNNVDSGSARKAATQAVKEAFDAES